MKKLDHETKTLNCKINAEIYDKLERTCIELGMSKKSFIELAIEHLAGSNHCFFKIVKDKFPGGNKGCN